MAILGFYGVDGRPVVVPSRRCLSWSYVQEALRYASRIPGVRLRCCCGELFLVPFLDPRFPGEIWNVRRESETDAHARGCFAAELGAFPAPPTVYTPGAFDEPEICNGPVEPGKVAGGARAVRHGSFTHFGHQLFARASMLALRSANAGKTYRDLSLRPFTVQELHAAVRSTLDNYEFKGGQPLVAALHSRRREMLWGITTAPLASVLAGVVAGHCDCQILLKGLRSSGASQAACERNVRLPWLVAARTGGRRTVMGEVIAPPYWIFVTVDSRPRREGNRDVYTATRVVAFPIAAVDAPYAVESEFERDVIVLRHRQGFALLKPGVHYALGELGTDWWDFGLLPNGRLPHRPDLIAYTKGRCWLVELAGLDGNPDYLEEVDRRLEAMVKVAAHAAVKPHRVDRKKFNAAQRTGTGAIQRTTVASRP